MNLETTGRKSGARRVATIWFVHERGVVYVQSGREGKTDWYRNLAKNPRATLEFDGFRTRGCAARVDDAAETKRIHDLFRAKYWMAWIGGWIGRGFGTGRVVRVTPGDATKSGTGDCPPFSSP